MKKYFAIAFLAATLVACDNDAEETTVETTETTESSHTAKYNASEGDAKYIDGKLMVYRNNDWVEADGDVEMNDGVVVYRNGEVKRNGEVVVLEDGEVVTTSGKILDKTGEAIEDAWDATKKGAKEAGQAVEKAAQKTKDAITGDDNK